MLVHARAQTADELAGLMGKVDVLPKMRNAFVRAGMDNIISARHTRREVVTGTLAPLGRFRGPMAVRTNASVLHLLGPGLSAFADWQVRGRALFWVHSTPVRSRGHPACECLQVDTTQ